MSLSKKIIFASVSIALVAEALLVFIIYLNPHKMTPVYSPALQMWINALLNSLSALSLLIARIKIHQKLITHHKLSIHMALFFSGLFLINYILYHMSVGHVVFSNASYRSSYLVLLITHLSASFISLPLIFCSYALGIFGKITEHKRLAKITFGLWLWVSVSGVFIVLMLKFLN